QPALPASNAPNPSTAPNTAQCTIVGGAGAPLFDGATTRADCDTQCSLSSSTHPNLGCSWNAGDITPTGQCAIHGGAGLELFPGVISRGTCNTHCLSTAVTNPNLKCSWSAIDITPTGNCSIVGGVGAQLAT